MARGLGERFSICVKPADLLDAVGDEVDVFEQRERVEAFDVLDVVEGEVQHAA